MWLDVDEGIKPTLYAAVSPEAQGAKYYGPRGFYETVRGSHFRGCPPAGPQRTRHATAVAALRTAHRCRLSGLTSESGGRWRSSVAVTSRTRMHSRTNGNDWRAGVRVIRCGCRSGCRRQHQEFPGNLRMPNALTAHASALGIPDEPDWARMRTRRSAAAIRDGRTRCRRADLADERLRRIRDRRQLAAPGRRPVARGAPGRGRARRGRASAPVHAVPQRGVAEYPVPDDHLHGPAYLESDYGVRDFARALAGLVGPGAQFAVDELTGAMRRAAATLSPRGHRRMRRSCSAPRSW